MKICTSLKPLSLLWSRQCQYEKAIKWSSLKVDSLIGQIGMTSFITGTGDKAAVGQRTHASHVCIVTLDRSPQCVVLRLVGRRHQTPIVTILRSNQLTVNHWITESLNHCNEWALLPVFDSNDVLFERPFHVLTFNSCVMFWFSLLTKISGYRWNKPII